MISHSIHLPLSTSLSSWGPGIVQFSVGHSAVGAIEERKPCRQRAVASDEYVRAGEGGMTSART